jgi:hypothetical protein
MRTTPQRLEEFLFPAISDRWLAILRIGLGVQMELYCLSLLGDWKSLFAFEGAGWINRDLTEAILTASTPFVPRLGWLVALGGHVGLSEATVLALTWASLLGTGLLLICGLCCRTASLIAWFLYVCAAKSGNLFAYGVDTFVIVGLFYLVIAPQPDRYALDRRIRKMPVKNPHLQGFFRRVLQLHLCVIYFSGGISKCLGSGWWNGDSMWRALTCPPFNALPSYLVVEGGAMLPALGIAILILETLYPIFIWPARTRPIWLSAIICMHIGIGFTMGLYLFSFIMIVLNLAAFGPEYLFREREPEVALTPAI